MYALQFHFLGNYPQLCSCCSISFLSAPIVKDLHRFSRHMQIAFHLWSLSVLHTLNLSWFLSICSQYLETHSSPEPQRPYMALSQKHSLLDKPQLLRSPKNHRGQQEPRNKTHPQQRDDQILAPGITIISNPDSWMPT